MTIKQAIEYLRAVTAGDPVAKKALDRLTELGQLTNDLAALHDIETRKQRAAPPPSADQR